MPAPPSEGATERPHRKQYRETALEVTRGPCRTLSFPALRPKILREQELLRSCEHVTPFPCCCILPNTNKRTLSATLTLGGPRGGSVIAPFVFPGRQTTGGQMQGFPRVHVRKYGKSPTAAVGDTTLGYSENANGLTMERGCDFQLPVSFESEPNVANISFQRHVCTHLCMYAPSLRCIGLAVNELCNKERRQGRGPPRRATGVMVEQREKEKLDRSTSPATPKSADTKPPPASGRAACCSAKPAAPSPHLYDGPHLFRDGTVNTAEPRDESHITSSSFISLSV